MASVVTGISPKEGKPGTKLTIRGENFGSSPSDLVLRGPLMKAVSLAMAYAKEFGCSALVQPSRKLICVSQLIS